MREYRQNPVIRQFSDFTLNMTKRHVGGIRGTSKSYKLTTTRAIIAHQTYRILATVIREYQVLRRVRNPAVKRCSHLRGFVSEENAQNSGISMSSRYIVEKGQRLNKFLLYT